MTAFVGRRRVLDALDAAFAVTTQAPSGLPRLPGIVLITGAAGMGKTSLLARWAGSAEGARVAWGTCWSGDGAPALWAWSQVLRGLPDPQEAMLSRLPAALSALMPEWADPARPSSTTRPGAGDRLQVFDAVATILDAATRSSPLVVVLDDLQWADPSTVDLCHYLAGRPHPGAILLLGAYRPDEVGADTAAALGRLGGSVERIPLGGLTAREVEQVLTTIAGEGAADRAAHVHARTGGHPFLVRELAHALAAGVPDDRIPAGVSEAVDRRMASVSPGTADLLAAAAVLGSPPTPDVLAAMTDRPADHVAEQLGQATSAGLLVESGFAHDIFREAVYATVPPARRIDLHRRAALALVRRAEQGGQAFPAGVARHYAEAASVCGFGPALEWARRAAAADAERFAFAEAAGHLSRTRESIERAGLALDDGSAADLLAAEADARLRAGDADAARRAIEQAWSRAVASDSAPRIGAVALGWNALGARFAMPRGELVGVLATARDRLAGSGTPLEARVTAALARELQHSVAADRPLAEPLARRAVDIARTLGDPDALSNSLLARHDLLWSPGNAVERAEIASEMADLAIAAGDVERQAQALLLTATARLELGSPAFRVSLASFEDLSRRLHQPRHDYLVLTRRAAVAILDGDIDAGDRLSEQAAALGEQVGETDAGNVRMSQLLEITRARGDPEALRAFADRAVRWWIGAPAHAHAVAAGFLARAGDLDRARDELDVVLGLPDLLTDRSYLWSVFVGEIVAAAVALDDRPLCERLLGELLPVGDACGVNGAAVCFAGAHAQRIGELLATIGEPAAARTRLEQAVRIHRGLGALAWEAESCAALAALDGSVGYADRAQALAGVLGLSGVTARLNRFTAKTSGAPRLERAGEVWHLQWAGRTVTVRDTKGLQDLAVLLDRPGVDVPSVELAGAVVDVRPTRTDPVLDRTAATAYRRRLAALADEVDQATAEHDLARRERAVRERDRLLTELRRAARPDGRPRQLGASTTERSRKAVTARIRDAIDRIRAVDPDLAGHLDGAVRTGVMCRYQPEFRA